LFVLEAELPAQFHPAHFKPGEEIAVVDHSHLIGFSVAHPHRRFVEFTHVVGSVAERAVTFSPLTRKSESRCNNNVGDASE